MNSRKSAKFAALAPALLGSLLGCATARPCTSDACVSDARISSQVQAAMAQRPELQAPNSVRVQTAGAIVYLHGHVSTGLQREEAEEVARQIPNVRQVVDSLRTTGAGG